MTMSHTHNHRHADTDRHAEKHLWFEDSVQARHPTANNQGGTPGAAQGDKRQVTGERAGRGFGGFETKLTSQSDVETLSGS